MNRRDFVKAAAGSAAPLIIPSHVLGKPGRPGANDRIKIGIIGVGARARWLMSYMGTDLPEAEIVAVCDLYLARCHGKDPGLTRATPLSPNMEKWAKYQDFRRMFEKEKLDAVFVETTTHARVWCAMHALQAGVDVYCEKPLTLTIEEGRVLTKAARKLNRVLQVGSQQRSMPINRYASELVRSGKIGKIQTVTVCNFLPGLVWKPQPPQPTPEGLDWNTWCNQTELRPYHPKLHYNWSTWWDYDCGGLSWGVSGWGTHALDQVQCALGADDTGPVEIWTENEKTQDSPNFPFRKRPDWNEMADRKPVTMRFASGTLVKLEEPCKDGHDQLGAIFHGTKGTIKIIRGNFTADPEELKKGAPDVLPEGKGEDAPHMRNFFECLRTRKRPNADVEIAHRATTLCHMVDIARKMDRKLTWDPKAERFTDQEANKMISRPRRKGFELPKV